MDTIISYLTYKIGNETFASNVSNVLSIIECSDITKVPNAPDYLIGVMNLRNEALPIIDSRIKLNIKERTITNNTSVIVLETSKKKNKKIGLLVDGVSDVIEIRDKDIENTPTLATSIKHGVIYGLYHKDNEFMMMLNLEKVLIS